MNKADEHSSIDEFDVIPNLVRAQTRPAAQTT